MKKAAAAGRQAGPDSSDIARLREKYRRNLEDGVIPFWLRALPRRRARRLLDLPRARRDRL